MRIFRSLNELATARSEILRPVVTTGFFDGLHLGHRSLLDELSSWARDIEGTPCVLTFQSHPASTLRGWGPPRIHSLEHRLVLLEQAGVEVALVLEFSEELAEWSPETFCSQILTGAYGSGHFLMGFDACVGRDRQGTFEYLSARASDLELEIRQATPYQLEGERVSSTLVRRAIDQGDLQRLKRLTGRPYSIFGTVMEGDGRGRELGFPTANLDVQIEAVLPAGVYFARVHPISPEGAAAAIPEPCPALVNLGRRPTFKKPLERAGGEKHGQRIFEPGLDTIEAHLLDFSGDLYGARLEVTFLERLRSEMKFSGPDALVQQIRRDEAEFRSWLERTPIG